MNPMDMLKMLPCMPGADGKGNPLEGIMKMVPCMPGATGTSGSGEANPIANVLQMVQGYCSMIPMLMSMLQGFGGLGNLGGMLGSSSPPANNEVKQQDEDTIEISDDTYETLKRLDDVKDLLKDIDSFKDDIREIINIAKNTRVKSAKKAQTRGV